MLKDRLHVWFIGKEDKNFQAAYFDPKDLKEDFASTQLLVVALATVNPATEQQGKYLVEILRPVTNRLRNLLGDPSGFSGEQRAQLNHALGLGLWAVGEQSGQSQDLVYAAAAYRAALTEWTRERVPLKSAAAQNNLAAALSMLGERKSSTARLLEAVAVYRAVLTEWTRERVPLDWAMTQNNLGGALWTLGEGESGTAWLEEAVVSYLAALQEWTRERVPFRWAVAQENLAAAYRSLATRAKGNARRGYLRDALVALEGALEVYREGKAAFYIEQAERLHAEIVAERGRVQAP